MALVVESDNLSLGGQGVPRKSKWSCASGGASSAGGLSESTATGVPLRPTTSQTNTSGIASTLGGRSAASATIELLFGGNRAGADGNRHDDYWDKLEEEMERVTAEQYERELDLSYLGKDKAPGPTITMEAGRFFPTNVPQVALTKARKPQEEKQLASQVQRAEELMCFCFARDINRGGSIAMGRQDGCIVVAPSRKSGFGSDPVLLKGHRGAVRCLLALPRGCALPPSQSENAAALLASGATDASIILWEPEQMWRPGLGAASGCIVQTLRGHEGTVTSLARVGVLLVSGATDRTTRVWRATGGRTDAFHPWFECTYVLPPADGWVNTLNYATTSRVDDPGALAIGDSAGTLRVFYAVNAPRMPNGDRPPVGLSDASGSKVVTRTLPNGVQVARVWAEEEIVVVLCYDHTMRIYELGSAAVNVAKAAKVTVHNPAGCAYTGVDFDERRRNIVLSDREGYISLYSLERESVVFRERVSEDALVGVGYSETAPDYSVLSGGPRGVRYVHFDRDHDFTRTRIGPDEDHGHVMSVISVDLKRGPPPSTHRVPENGFRIFSVALDNRILQWDPVTSQIVQTLTEDRSEIVSMMYDDLVHGIVTGHVDGVVRLWDVDTGSTCNLRELPIAVTALCSADISSDSSSPDPRVFAGCANGQVALFDFSRRRGARPMLVSKFAVFTEGEGVTCLFHDPLQKALLVSGSNGTIRMFHRKLLMPIGTYCEKDAQPVHSAGCVAADTAALLSGCEDGRVRVWSRNIAGWNKSTFQVRKGYARESAGVDKQNTEHRSAPISSFVAHSGPVLAIGVPGLGRCVTCAEDGRVVAWLYGSGQVLHACAVHPEPTTCLALYVERKLAIVGCASGAVLRFALPDSVFIEGIGDEEDSGEEIDA